MSAAVSSPTPHRAPTRLLAGLLIPLAAFAVLAQTLASATTALAISEALPLLWVIAFAVWRRRIDWIALVPIAAFALALALTIALGGSSLPLELRRAVFPGLLGFACLASIAAGRPLLAVLAGRAERPHGRDLETPRARRALATVTAIIGVTCVTDAGAQVVLALTVSTTTFGLVARVASYAIIGSGLAVCGLYVRSVRARLRATPPR